LGRSSEDTIAQDYAPREEALPAEGFEATCARWGAHASEREIARMIRMGARLQSAIVVCLTALILAATLPAAFVGWALRGDWGTQPLAVVTVEAGSPAARAGLVPGDRILYGNLPFAARAAYAFPLPGAHVTVPVEHAGQIRTVSMTADAKQLQDLPFARWLTVLEFVTYAVYLIVGATLVFMRPSPMTWWLWAYCVTWVPITWLHWFYAFLPGASLSALVFFTAAFMSGSAILPLLPFLLRFPNDRIEGWRKHWRWPVTAVMFAGYVYYIVLVPYRYSGRLTIGQVALLDKIPYGLVALGALALLLVTFSRATGDERQRLRWAVVGMTIAFVALFVAYGPIPTPRWVAELFAVISISMPLSVAYAALRHRLIDVGFVLNRAVAYGLVAGLLIAIVSLTDFLISHVVADYHLTLGIEAVITIGLGFAMDRLHRAMQLTTERIFFRSRLLAAARLQRVRGALAFASRDVTVEAALIGEPVAAFALASAGLFRRDPASGSFKRGESVGWQPAEVDELDPDDALVRILQFERKPLDPTDIPWKPGALPREAGQPTFAVPIFCRETLEAFAVYGSHRDGAATDPAERELLCDLAPAAAAALDHIAFEESERTIAELKRRLSSAGVPLELGGAPAE
jgi:hypothetical protein